MQSLPDNLEVHSDQSVIDHVLQGDTAFFEILIRRYNPVLYKIARSYGFLHHDAEDLMQDTHVAAYGALRNFEGRSSYKTWISRIMVNKCLYKLKYGHFRNEIVSENVTDINHEYMQGKKSHDGEDILLNRELAVILEKSLARIPVIYRTVFVLREMEGFSVAETSELLHISPINVKVRLSRAKLLLQKQVEHFYSHKDLYAFNLIYCDGIVQQVFRRINGESPSPGTG